MNGKNFTSNVMRPLRQYVACSRLTPSANTLLFYAPIKRFNLTLVNYEILFDVIYQLHIL